MGKDMMSTNDNLHKNRILYLIRIALEGALKKLNKKEVALSCSEDE